MVMQHHSQRRKFYNSFVEGAVPSHGHVMEYVLTILNIVISLFFVIGSWCFLYSNLVALGSYIFIVGSFLIFFMQLHAIWEERSSKHCKDPIVDREMINEFREHIAFAFSGLLFAVGSIFYIPGIAHSDDENVKKLDESWGSWIFIAGSFGYVLAAFFNAIAMVDSKEERNMTPIYSTCHKLHIWGLLCAMIGSMFFFTGSFLYRPGLASRCEEAEGSAADWCTDSSTLGTWFFILGSVLYLVESLLSFTCSALKHSFGEKELAAKDALLRQDVHQTAESLTELQAAAPQ